VHKLEGAISCDVDTLASIYKGYGLQRPGGYTFAEFRMGMENFCRFLEPFGVRATLFMVGHDFQHAHNIPYIKDALAAGFEIANHSLSHAQGFRLLDSRAKEAEIVGMQALCEEVTGKRPVGFRSPGWNVSDDALPILKKQGYLYDSSVFPSLLNPLLKIYHWKTMHGKPRSERTTLGHVRYILAPTRPYFTSDRNLGRKGKGGILEFPITVVPKVRLPFSATYLLLFGIEVFKICYRELRTSRSPIQFQFHLSDFVDYGHPDLKDQVPRGGGVYIPQALNFSLKKKVDLFRRALGEMAEHYQFVTLEQWALKLLKERFKG
jgi:hypothetical protein